MSYLTYVDDEIIVLDEQANELLSTVVSQEVKVIKSYYGSITAYGPDCVGCTTGKTASGYNVTNGNIYYNDKTYGQIRIVAGDKSLPFGTIVRISGLKNSTDLLVIVLDRGSAIGFNKKAYFDLLYAKESQTNAFGRQKATFDILRLGY